MGYYVRYLPRKKNPPTWKIQYVSYKPQDRKSTSQAKISKTTWDLSKDRWRPLGFHPSMSFLEAQARARQLNSQLRLKRQEEQIKKIQDKKNVFQLRHESALPPEFVTEFEERFVHARGLLSEVQRKRRNKQRHTTWRAAQRMIVAVGIEPSQWFYHHDNFYEAICQNEYSLGYAKSILNMVNLWGHFMTRKLGQLFYPVRQPRGYERQRILEIFYRKTFRRRRPSESITPEHLEKIKPSINLKNFNWIYISVWLGLRPQEIDQLMNAELWKIEVLPTGRKVLWVFQTKIIALPPDDRWKPIPILFDEQHFTLRIISEKNFKRPLVKTIRKHIGPGHDLYGGRKGFVDLMLEKKQTLENISIWMGHSTLSRTWRSYKNKRVYQAS
jgi:hypothetical protein